MYKQIDSNKRKTVILIAIFTAVLLLIGWTIGQTSNLGYSSVVIAGVISFFMSIGGYFYGDRVALSSAAAQGPITQADNTYAYRLVENLAITSGIPMPKVYIINDPSINAFATGRNPQHASIAITTGAIEKLKNEELEGVIAHEMSHIKNYDILVMTIVIILVGLTALLSDWFIRSRFWGGGREKNENNGQLQSILMIVGIILLILSPLIGQLIKLAVSRKREFLADASGALLTRYPDGLANALEKIEQENLPVQHATNATAHLYFSNPFRGGRHMFSNLFATHPPIEERIATLRSMTR